MRTLNTAPPAKRDPAPSRFSYRIQRLWLTPSFRTFIRKGIPIMAVAGAVGWYFNVPENREQVVENIAEFRRSVELRPEFMVKLMAIDGASAEIGEDIREVVPVDFPISSFDLDLAAMQDRIEELDAVSRVDLRVRSGGILQVTIHERTPAVVWRTRLGLELLDDTGHRVSALNVRSQREDLPLLAGLGVENHVPEALEILSAAGPIVSRVRGLVRMGERRWDVILDRDQRIMLPEVDPVAALEQVIALDQAKDLLARDLIAVDMRNRDRPTLRMAKPAVDELRRIKDIVAGARN